MRTLKGETLSIIDNEDQKKIFDSYLYLQCEYGLSFAMKHKLRLIFLRPDSSMRPEEISFFIDQDLEKEHDYAKW